MDFMRGMLVMSVFIGDKGTGRGRLSEVNALPQMDPWTFVITVYLSIFIKLTLD